MLEVEIVFNEFPALRSLSVRASIFVVVIAHFSAILCHITRFRSFGSCARSCCVCDKVHIVINTYRRRLRRRRIEYINAFNETVRKWELI